MAIKPEADQTLYEKAIGGDVDAQILWLSTRCPDKWGRVPEQEADDENRLDSD